MRYFKRMAKKNKTLSQALIPAPVETDNRRGRQKGFIDSNPKLTPDDLLGRSIRDVGEFFMIRNAHWIVASQADYRRDEIRNMKFVIKPRRGDDSSLDEQWCARAIAELLQSGTSFNLSRLIADIDDRVSTYGFALYELQVADTVVALHAIPAFAVREIKGNSENIESVRVSTAIGTEREIYPPRLVWFGDPPERGQWYGVSKYRRILAVINMVAQDSQIYLEQRRLERGMLIVEETGENPSEQSRNEALDFLVDYYNGKLTPFVAGSGYKVAHIAASNPGNSEFVGRMQYFDSMIREAVNSALTSLGISGAGSLALGKEFSIRDAEKFASSVKASCVMASGTLHGESNWLGTVAELLGFKRSDAPVIEPDEDIEVDIGEKISDINTLVSAGIVDAGAMKTERNQRRLFRALGLHYDAPATPAESAARDAVEELSEQTQPGEELYTPPQSVINAASDAYAVHMATPTAARALNAQDCQTARLLMSGAGLPRWKVERLAAQLRLMNPTTVRQTQDWIDRGPEWQRWHAHGADAAVEWLNQIMTGAAK
jgi:hypothetical protein